MKKIIIALLLLFLAMSACTAEKETFNFRGIEFGMTMDKIRNLETGILREDAEEILFYEIEDMYGLKAYIGYSFNRLNKLKEIGLSLMVPADMDHKIKYAEIKEDLWIKYKGDEEPRFYAGWLFENDVTFTQCLKVCTKLYVESENYLVGIFIEFSATER